MVGSDAMANRAFDHLKSQFKLCAGFGFIASLTADVAGSAFTSAGLLA